MTFCYEVHGLALASELALPELEPRRRPAGTGADVHIVLGRVTESASAATSVPYLASVDDSVQVTIQGIARYQVTAGRTVLVDPHPDADFSHVRLFLLGSVIGLVCHQRGLLPLHASAIEFAGQALAFIGQQGQGKSTLAAHCLQHAAARLVADDILVVSFDAEGRPWAQPGMPSVKLWRDALTALGKTVDGLRPDWLRADKFHLPVHEDIAKSSVPLRCVYVLGDNDQSGAASIEPVGGAAAAAMLIANTYRVEYLDAAAQRHHHFESSTRLARSVSVRALNRRRDLSQIAATVAAVLDDARQSLEAAH